MKRFIFAIIALMFIASCGPSVNPQLKSKIDKYNTTAGAGYGASGKFISPMPLAVGQYTICRNTNDGDISISRTSIIGREQGGWIIDSYSLTSSSESAVQMLVTGLDKAAKTGNADDIDFVWVKIKDEKGNVQKLEGTMLSMMKSLYKNNIPNMKIDTRLSKAGGAVKVPAGSFAGTYTVKAEVKMLGRTYKSTGWYHTAVPINGLVKSVSEDGDTVSELIKFGTKGTVSSF